MNLYEHYLVINVALHVCNIVIKLLLAAHRIIQSVSGILNVVHVYVRWKDMMNWFVVFVLIPNIGHGDRALPAISQTHGVTQIEAVLVQIRAFRIGHPITVTVPKAVVGLAVEADIDHGLGKLGQDQRRRRAAAATGGGLAIHGE